MKQILNLFLALSFAFNCYAAKDEFSSEELREVCSPTECFTVIKTLGEGAFGKVYAVEDSSGQQYALKSYKNFDDTQYFMNNVFSNVEREYSIGQRLNHPNIIKTYDFFSTSLDGAQTDYLLLQLVEGVTVSGTPLKTFSTEQTLAATLQLLDALKHAYSLGLMHLDLHGGNVMLSHQADLMVIDVASFFNFDELTYSFELYESTLTPKSETISTNRHTDLALKDSDYFNSLEPKNIKLQRLFKENPQLVKKLQEAKAAFSNRQLTQASTKSTPINSMDYSDYFKLSMLQFYLDRITEMCVRVIAKGQLSREEKISLRSEIKKISWNYEADLEEGLSPDFMQYLETVIDTIEFQRV